MKNLRLAQAILLMMMLIAGCDEDKRLVDMAQQADERQAEQNRQIAHQNHQIAEATKQLVEADAKSRQELVALERDLQAERATIGRQRDQLEAERRNIVRERRWDSATGTAVDNAATIVACLLPLVLCWFLLRGSPRHDPDEAIGEILTVEIAADHSLLLADDDARQERLASANDHLPGLPGEAEKDGPA